MQKFKSFIRILATLFLVFAFWIVSQLMAIIHQDNANHNQEYIPEHSVFVAVVDGDQFMKTSFYSVIMSDDERVLNLFMQRRRRKNREDLKPVGIAFDSKIILFISEENGHTIFGSVFNISNPRQFEENITHFIDKDNVFALNNTIGIVLSESEKINIRPLSKKELQSIADLYVSGKSKFPTDEISTSGSTIMANAWLKSDSKYTRNTDLSFDVDDLSVKVKGAFELEEQPDHPKKQLKKKGISLFASILPEFIADSLNSSIGAFGIPEVQFKGISLNFYGTRLDGNSNLLAEPQFDALIYLEDSLNFEAFIEENENELLQIQKDQKTIQVDGFQLHYKQIGPKTIYVGISETYELVASEKKKIFEVSGNHKALLNIEGGGIIRRIIEITPEYSSSKQLADEMKYFNIAATQEGKQVTIQGNIEFKKGNYALNSLMKFALASELF